MKKLQSTVSVLTASLERGLRWLRMSGWWIFPLFFFSASSQVPQKKTVALQVSATVLHPAPVELFTLRNISLKRASGGDLKYYISPTESPDAGMVVIRGTAGSKARISYQRITEFKADSGNGIVRMVCETAISPVQIQHASLVISSDELVITFNRDGFYYLWIGGMVDLEKAYPGRYNGLFTFEIDYL